MSKQNLERENKKKMAMDFLIFLKRTQKEKDGSTQKEKKVKNKDPSSLF